MSEMERVARLVFAWRDRRIDMDGCKQLNIDLHARGVHLSLSELDHVLWLSDLLAAERTGLLDHIAALRESLAAIVRCLEEAGDAYEAAKSAITRADTAADNARDEMQRLIAKASEVPGMSATIDELRKKATVLP